MSHFADHDNTGSYSLLQITRVKDRRRLLNRRGYAQTTGDVRCRQSRG